ncbi:MAG: cellulose biosynthesis cyclic di-GMP-binding regulatory protein BcsB [Chloroflexi bacterium]|nr:cellulose biosynthesis cyclic di-GMP-binding regulatory protein BcsB [Chloroflexota bacterium]MBI3339393.1 cellulose biosynthesis cyclic di-GMP-binding regulatory protein BcsB [Chloroflexota bacterium]
MRKKFASLLLVSIVFISFLMSQVISVQAQGAITPSVSFPLTARQFKPLAADPNIVTWDILGQSETRLVGPYDSNYFAFGLPADWKLTGGTQLNLSLAVTISTGVQGQATATSNQNPYGGTVGGGTLTVILNSTALAVLPLDQTGEIQRSIPIPVEAFKSDRGDGRMVVGFILNSGFSCYLYDQMNVIIRTSSFFTLPHDLVSPSTSLVNFPRPLYQNSFIPDSALIVIPDKPSSGELQAAMTIASGLGNLTSGALSLDLTTLSKLTADQQAKSNLILVGNAASMPVLGQLQLPLPVSGGQFQLASDSPDDGLVQMINSPWSSANVVLAVSGNTDQGTIKAAQAVSTGVIRANKAPNLAVVQAVQTTPLLLPQQTDRTLTDLGYQGFVFENRGVESVSYNFNVPPGWAVDPEASFNLNFGHSALLDYNRSGIVVLLNGSPIGSVRLSDDTASRSVNKIIISIPATAVIPGNNRLDIKANLIPRDSCTPPNMRGLWVNIWSDSTLHLPMNPSPINLATNQSLASYPAPFTYYPVLDNTAFVLPHEDVEAWRAALQIAAYLGLNANGPLSAPSVFYGDAIPVPERSKYNLLVIGQPSQLPIVGEMNSFLPAPFSDGSPVPTEKNFQVNYLIPADSPMGYVEMLASPWNSDNVVLAVLGNVPQGVKWASSSLIDSTLRSKLAGNFAVINDRQIISTDTRLSPTINVGATQNQDVSVIPPSSAVQTTPKAERPVWILPALIILILLMVVILAVVAVGSWSRNRTRRKDS